MDITNNWNLLFILWLLAGLSSAPGETIVEETEVAMKRVNKVSDMVMNFLEHFKNPDSVNLPLPIPDPMAMPDRTYPLVTTTIKATNVKAYGVSNTRIDNFASDVVTMQLTFAVRMPRLQVTGNYSEYWSSYSGRFNVTIVDSNFECAAKLEVTRSGELEAADIKMEMLKHGEIVLDFQNFGVMRNFIKTLGELIFEGFKPYMFKIINSNVRGTVNEYLKKLKMAFPNSIPPIDLAIAEIRKFVRGMGYDPFFVPNYQYATSVYSLDITHITVIGVSSFYRLGNVKVTMENSTIHMNVHAGTEMLEGRCDWEAGLAGIITKSGTASFTIDYIHALTNIDQSLDVRKKPRVIDFRVKIGNIQLRMDGAGTVDYVMELVINVLPNMLRYQIVQAAEMPVKRKMQEVFDNFDVEQMIVQELPLIDKHLSGNVSNVIEEQFIEEGLVVGVNELDQDIQL